MKTEYISPEKWRALLKTPYKKYGRDFDGADCYGFAILMEKEAGRDLKDLINLDGCNIKKDDLNIKERRRAEKFFLVEFDFQNHTHVGVMINTSQFLHMTYEGVRCGDIKNHKIRGYYDIV